MCVFEAKGAGSFCDGGEWVLVVLCGWGCSGARGTKFEIAQINIISKN